MSPCDVGEAHVEYLCLLLDTVSRSITEFSTTVSAAWDNISEYERMAVNLGGRWDATLSEAAACLANFRALSATVRAAGEVVDEYGDVGEHVSTALAHLREAVDEAGTDAGRLLATIDTLPFPQSRSILHHSPDSGPGQGMKYRTVKVRLAESLIVLRIVHYTFRPPSPGHSQDNVVERSQSAVTEAALHHQPRPGQVEGKFQNLSLAELKKGKLDVSRLPEVERATMKEHSWRGAEALATICNGVPCMGSVLRAATGERTRACLFPDDAYLRRYCKATEKARPLMPGGQHYLRMEAHLLKHSVINHESHYLEFVAAADDCRPGLEPPPRMPLPVPDTPFAGDPPLLPTAAWTRYKQFAELGPNSNKQHGLDQDINLYNPQRLVDECFADNLATFFNDWWEVTQSGVPPNELQYIPPPLSIGLAAHALVVELCQRCGASTEGVCRRIAHNLNLVGNIKRFAAAGAKAAGAARKKGAPRAGGGAKKGGGNRKRSRSQSDSDDSSDSSSEVEDENMQGGSDTDDRVEDTEKGSDTDGEDFELAEATGRVPWALLHALKLHELRALAESFLQSDEFAALPLRKADVASYLAVTGDIQLEPYNAFLAAYRRSYVAQPRAGQKRKELVVVMEAATAQEQRQYAGGNKDSNKRQKELYTAALKKHKEQHSGKSPTVVQATKLWDEAAQCAHEGLTEVIQQGRPKRKKRTLVDGLGFIDLP
jgi:hypothetical protein